MCRSTTGAPAVPPADVKAPLLHPVKPGVLVQLLPSHGITSRAPERVR